MTRRRLVLLTAGAVMLAAAFAPSWGRAHQGATGQPRLSGADAGAWRAAQQAFNVGKNDVRLVLLLSPT